MLTDKSCRTARHLGDHFQMLLQPQLKKKTVLWVHRIENKISSKACLKTDYNTEFCDVAMKYALISSSRWCPARFGTQIHSWHIQGNCTSRLCGRSASLSLQISGSLSSLSCGRAAREVSSLWHVTQLRQETPVGEGETVRQYFF